MENTRITTKACTKENKNTQILLSTYNGEKYLREQLDSFVILDGFENIKVLVRDDGSTDGTLNILYEYRDKYKFEIIEGKNIGLNKSMLQLFKHCDMTCDYFAYSDQDDVWIKDKFAIALKMLEQKSNKIPLLFSSCSEVVDQKLKFISNTAYPSKGIDFYNAMVQNIARGHTQVFNRTMMEELRNRNFDIEKIYYLDWWIYIIATGIGEVVFSEKTTVKYRQHEDNVLGYKKNHVSDFKKKIKLVLRDECRAMARQLYEFERLYANALPTLFSKELCDYRESQKKFILRVKYIINTKVYRQSSVQSLAFKILYIFGKYNI